MLRRTFLLTFLSLFVSHLFAAPAPTGAIRGQLLDEVSKNPLDHVTVFVYKGEDKKLVKTVNTDEQGLFIFSDILPGIYRIEAGFLGYLPLEEQVEVLANQSTQMGELPMKANAKALGVVEVTGLRSTVKLEADKRVFSVDQSVAAAGASTSDVLKNIPSVEVDGEGTISLRNSSNVIVWINGKPSGLTADNRSQVLEQMPAESIDRIEVITNPSAKYSAEGTAGIINIILKKDRKAGYYGSLRAGVSQPTGFNLGGNLNYSSSKLDLYGNLGWRDEHRLGSGTTHRTFYTASPDQPDSYLDMTTDRDFNMKGLFFRAGIDYHIDDRHTLSLSGFGMQGNRNYTGRVSNLYLSNLSELTRTSERSTDATDGHGHSELEFDYQWEIGPDHNLHLVLSTGTGTGPNSSRFDQTDRSADGLTSQTFTQDGLGDEQETERLAQLDYVKKFSDRFKVEAGWKTTTEDRLATDQVRNLDGDNWLMLTKNAFDYSEQIHAAYVTTSGKWSPKLGYQLGLRAEKTVIGFTSTDVLTQLSEPHHKNYLKWFPTLSVSYTMTEGSDLQLLYSRRINRPNGRMLNPFANLTDSTNIRIGNPGLNPEFTDAFELNFLKSWTDHTLTAALYHRMSEQVIQEIRYLDGGIMKQTPENATSSTSSGLELVAKDKLFRVLETTTTFNLYHESMDGFTYLGQQYEGNSGFSWNLRANGQWMLPKGWLGQISGFYSGPRIIAQGRMKAAGSLDLGLRKSFFDRTLQVSVNGQNLLNTFRFESTTKGQGFIQESSSQFFGRTIRLNVAWNFGNLKPKEKPEKNGASENGGRMEGDF